MQCYGISGAYLVLAVIAEHNIIYVRQRQPNNPLLLRSPWFIGLQTGHALAKATTKTGTFGLNAVVLLWQKACLCHSTLKSPQMKDYFNPIRLHKRWMLACNTSLAKPKLNRLRVVPHFSSGIVEWAKRERQWKSPHLSPFSRGLIFTRALVSLALLSLRKNGGLLVV